MNILKTLLATAAATALVGSAHALPTLTLKDLVTNTTVVVVDGSGGDLATGVDGVVEFSGTVGQWSLSVTTGISNSPNGNDNGTAMHLNTVDTTKKVTNSNVFIGSGTLQITFTDSGFTLPANAKTVYAHVGGVLGGNTNSWVTYATKLNAASATSQTFNGTGSATSFSGDASKGFGLIGNPYSLTQIITLHHSVAATSSIDANVSVPDGGLTAALVGMGLLGTAAAARRRRLI